ncbi:signal peptidase II [Streptomyces sp. NBC_00237]|uniref:signal peptidase II n=1 Tax=Streptomyces sp. NBC_00237 TaxID=2975687 RepID=UPI002253C8E2|nr:signal peptidase II [Streptomyces sp. NBC_00237]MCX5206335.1 signal peptidase II [Streptomyces sp. NBC_00237]
MDEARSRGRFGLIAVMAAIPLAVDLATKQMALAHFSPADPVSTLGGLLKFTLISNSGAAFSLGEGTTWLFTAAKIIVITGMLWVARRVRVPLWGVVFGLLVGGAAGNLVDRVFRPPSPMQGAVIDWIQLPYWPVFNIADMSVVCGGILAVVAVFRGITLDGSPVPDKAKREPKRDSS